MSGDSEPRGGIPGLRWMSEGHVWIAIGVLALIAVGCFGTASSVATNGREVMSVVGGIAAVLAFLLFVARLFAGSGRHQQAKATQDGPEWQERLNEARRRENEGR